MKFTAEHALIRKTARAIIDKHINPHVDEWEAAGMFPAHQVFKLFGEQGLLGLKYPEEYGGQTLDRQSYWIAGDPWSMIITCDGTDPVATERIAIAESFEWLRPADTAGLGREPLKVDAAYVDSQLKALSADEDLSRFIL